MPTCVYVSVCPCKTTDPLITRAFIETMIFAVGDFCFIRKYCIFQVLNFNGSGLSKLKLLSTLTNLKKLIVSFNELTTLQDLSGMVRSILPALA